MASGELEPVLGSQQPNPEEEIITLLVDIVRHQIEYNQLDLEVEQAIAKVKTQRESSVTDEEPFELQAQWALAEDAWRQEHSNFMRLHTHQKQNTLGKRLCVPLTLTLP